MILFLDTSDMSAMTFALVPKSGDVIRRDFSMAYNENDQMLSTLAAFLKQHKVLPENLDKIIACSGPGSFTGTRVGITIAQALGFAKRIPVEAIPKTKVPADLHQLSTIKGIKKLTIAYNRSPF